MRALGSNGARRRGRATESTPSLWTAVFTHLSSPRGSLPQLAGEGGAIGRRRRPSFDGLWRRMGCGPLLRRQTACTNVTANLRSKRPAFHTPSVAFGDTFPAPRRRGTRSMSCVNALPHKGGGSGAARPGAMRRTLASTAFIAATFVLFPGAAFATCVNNPGVNVTASNGETCTASGTYSSITPGLVAGEATGAGSKLTNGEGTASFSTSATAVTTPALLAVGGGSISLAGGTVTTSGDGSQGLLVNGPGSTIMMSGAAVITNGGFDSDTGSFANGLLATNGGSASFSGGSITTNGASAVAVASAGAGSSVTLSGTSMTPLAILTNGNGGGGVAVNGAGASLTATDVSITTHGNIDSSSGTVIPAFGAYNGAGPGGPAGGTMTLTNTTITTTGIGADGVIASNGGVTTISGGSISTSGASALGLYATGAGSSIATSNGTTIATGVVGDPTKGTNSQGVAAESGGAVSLTGGLVTTSGNASTGVFVTDAGSSITASGVAVTTNGGVIPGTGYSNALLALSGGSIAFSGGSITTNGMSASGAVAENGSSIVISGGTAILANGDGSGGGWLGRFDNSHGNHDHHARKRRHQRRIHGRRGSQWLGLKRSGRRHTEADGHEHRHDGRLGGGCRHKQRRRHDAERRIGDHLWRQRDRAPRDRRGFELYNLERDDDFDRQRRTGHRGQCAWRVGGFRAPRLRSTAVR